MLFLVKLNPEYSSKLLVEAKGTCALFLFLLAAKKKDIIVSFRWDIKILTADHTAGSAAVCKVVLLIVGVTQVFSFSLPGSSQLRRFLSVLKLLKNHHAAQAKSTKCSPSKKRNRN